MEDSQREVIRHYNGIDVGIISLKTLSVPSNVCNGQEKNNKKGEGQESYKEHVCHLDIVG